MNKLLGLGLLVVAVGATASASYDWDDKPEFIQSAETRVGSYLTSDYGKVVCSSTRINEQRWDLGCINQAKGKMFQYAVYSADQAPYAVSRPFYLEAINEDAKQSAEQGLMHYLQINTKTS
ncbi:hypothetical protein [unidentified bacterial endosymbiont]|uniref:hypothetical protein n=1 Tax=unidentified bacterial endosymbiont TaxID=2355 RepID=UPI00209DB7F2|nr:hypothetical protein [unidentified bacterial endosymbiont]